MQQEESLDGEYQHLNCEANNDDENDWDYDFKNSAPAFEHGYLDEATNFYDSSIEVDVDRMDPRLSLVPIENLTAPSSRTGRRAPPTEPTMVQGQQLSASVGAYSCDRCSYSSDSKHVMAKHRDRHSFTKTLACSHCHYKTLDQIHYSRHLSDHELERALASTETSEVLDLSDDWQMIVTGNNSSLDQSQLIEKNPKQMLINGASQLPETETLQVAKKTKITDYFSAQKAEHQISVSKPAPSLVPLDLKKRWGKFRCPYCKFKSGLKYIVVNHIKVHNNPEEETLDTVLEKEVPCTSLSNSVENVALPQRKTSDVNLEVHKNPICSDFKKSSYFSSQSRVNDDAMHIDCSPLGTYLRQSRGSVNDGAKENWPLHTGSLNVNMQSIKCPFCSVVTMRKPDHEDHIRKCHINSTITCEIESEKISPSKTRKPFSNDENEQFEPSDYQSTRPPSRASVRLSRSQYKINSALVEGILKTYDYESDFEGFDEPDFKGFTEDEIKIPSSLVRDDVREIVHKEQSNSEKPSEKTCFSCKLCDFTSLDKTVFDTHIDSAHIDQSTFDCKLCTFATTSMEKLLIHAQSRGCKTKNKSCPNCLFKSRPGPGYNKHRKQCDLLATQEGFCREGNYRCPFCQYKTFRKNLYKIHLLDHVRDELLSCPKCPFETSRKDMYRIHLRSVHNTKHVTIRCVKCSFTCMKSEQLTLHMKSHTGSRILKAESAVRHLDDSKLDHNIRTRKQNAKRVDENGTSPSKNVKSSSILPNVTDHAVIKEEDNESMVIRTTGSEIPESDQAECPLCSKIYASEEDLVAHFSEHTNGGKMLCPFCDFSTVQFSSLQKHLNTVH